MPGILPDPDAGGLRTSSPPAVEPATTISLRLPRSGRLLVLALDAVAVLTLLAYPTWSLGPAFAYYTGLVN